MQCNAIARYILGKAESDVCAGLGSRGEENRHGSGSVLDEGFSNQLPRVHGMVA
jgi:hypothetical protein